MLILRIVVCYLLVIALIIVFVWQARDPAAGLIFLFFMIAFVPSLIGTVFVLTPIEIYFMRRGKGAARFAATLVAGAVVPIIAFAILAASWGQIPRFSDGLLLWNAIGVGWALLWYISSWVFPTRWTPDADDLT